jgi:predicted phosphodiesterase
MSGRVRATLLVPAFLILFAIAWIRMSAWPDPTLSPEELNRPTAQPDRIVLTWSADPGTTQSVNWRTSTAVIKAVAEIALAEDGPLFIKKAKAVAATTEPFASDLGNAHMHSVTFTGLQPKTQYLYRVGDGWNWSEWFQFKTPAANPEPLSFLYVGDAQNDIHSLWSRVIRAAYSQAPDARFIIHAGDLVNVSNRDAEWGEWFRSAGWISGQLPYVPVPGNHEYPRSVTGKELTKHWRASFTLPSSKIPGLDETSYFFDIQGVRIVGLNSNEKIEEQKAWLDEILSKNPNRWTVLAFHHPIFSSAKGRDNKELREAWQPVIDKHKVDLVLTGHDHTYARSNLATGANARSQNGGTVYVVSVSGPKMYNLDREPWMQRAAEDTQLFQVIRIAGDKLRYESRTARGLLYDAFELEKRSGQANRLTNIAPELPENLRKPGSSETK